MNALAPAAKRRNTAGGSAASMPSSERVNQS